MLLWCQQINPYMTPALCFAFILRPSLVCLERWPHQIRQLERISSLMLPLHFANFVFCTFTRQMSVISWSVSLFLPPLFLRHFLLPSPPTISRWMWDNRIYQELWFGIGDIKCHNLFRCPFRPLPVLQSILQINLLLPPSLPLSVHLSLQQQ